MNTSQKLPIWAKNLNFLQDLKTDVRKIAIKAVHSSKDVTYRQERSKSAAQRQKDTSGSKKHLKCQKEIDDRGLDCVS